MSTQQSGLIDLKIADLARDGGILTEARNQALALLESDPNLEQEVHHGIREEISRTGAGSVDQKYYSKPNHLKYHFNPSAKTCPSPVK